MKRLFLLLALMLVAATANAQIPTGQNAGSSGGGGGTVTSVSGGNGITVSSPTTTPVVSLPTATAAQILVENAGATAFVPVTLSGGVTVGSTGTTTLAAPYGATTYTAHGVLLGEGSSNIAAMAACAAGAVVYGQGAADPVCSTLILPNAATTGDLIAATSTNTLGSIADVAVNQVLTSGGVGALPAFSATPTFAATNLTGTPSFTNINGVNALGAIAAAGTASCNLALGTICTFSGSSGTVNIAVPTNGAQNVQYLIIAYSTGTFSTSFNTATPGWRQWNYQTAADANPPDGNGVTNGNTMMIPFHYDGTNYRIDGFGEITANRTKTFALSANTIGASGLSSLQGVTGTTGSFAGTFAVTAGGPFSITGGTAPTLTAGCNGAGSAVAAGSTDNRGQITTQTAAATTCTLTFNHTWAQAPFCVAADSEATITPAAYSVGATGTTTVVFDFVSAANDKFNYFCE